MGDKLFESLWTFISRLTKKLRVLYSIRILQFFVIFLIIFWGQKLLWSISWYKILAFKHFKREFELKLVLKFVLMSHGTYVFQKQGNHWTIVRISNLMGIALVFCWLFVNFYFHKFWDDGDSGSWAVWEKNFLLEYVSWIKIEVFFVQSIKEISQSLLLSNRLQLHCIYMWIFCLISNLSNFLDVTVKT